MHVLCLHFIFDRFRKFCSKEYIISWNFLKNNYCYNYTPTITPIFPPNTPIKTKKTNKLFSPL